MSCQIAVMHLVENMIVVKNAAERIQGQVIIIYALLVPPTIVLSNAQGYKGLFVW